MAEIRLDLLNPEQISTTDNLVAYTEGKEVKIAIPDFATGSDLKNYVEKSGNTNDDPIIGDLYFNKNIILKFNNPAEILIQNSIGQTRNCISYHEWPQPDGSVLPQIDWGESDCQFNTNGNHVPTHDMKPGVNLDTEYSNPVIENKYRYVFYEWLINNFPTKSDLENYAKKTDIENFVTEDDLDLQLEEYIKKTGNSQDDPISGDLYFDQRAIFLYPNQVDIIARNDEGTETSLIYYDEINSNEETTRFVEYGDYNANLRTSSNNLPFNILNPDVDLDVEYAKPSTQNNFRYVFFEWLEQNYLNKSEAQQKSSLYQSDLSSTPSTAFVAFGNFTILIQHLVNNTLVLQIKYDGTSMGEVSYQILEYTDTNPQFTFGSVTLSNDPVNIGTFDDDRNRIEVEFDYLGQTYKTTYNKIKEDFSLVNLYIEQIG